MTIKFSKLVTYVWITQNYISSMFVVYILINDKKLAFSCVFDIKWIHLLAFRYMKIEGRIHDWIYTNEHIKMFSEC